MVERIIIFICCFMCAVPFFIISVFSKDSITPITFWSGGENSLKGKLKKIKEYNHEMALLYKKCAFAFLLAGICACIQPMIGLVLIGIECTIGIYLVYCSYKKILNKYS